MNWKIFFIKFLRNLILGVVMDLVLLGGFGYLLAGKEGLVNMAYWRVALGLIGGFSSGLGIIFEAKFWEAGNYPVRKLRPGLAEEGGDGVTVAWLGL